MDIKSLNKLIDQRIEFQNNSVNSVSISSHTHNGSNSLQVNSSDLLPYKIYDVNTQPITGRDNTMGKISLFDFSTNVQNPSLAIWSWGQNIFLGNQDNPINFADFFLSASQTKTQNFPDSTTTTVIYNVLNFQYPLSYDISTGKFSTVPRTGTIIPRISFESWYLITASVDINPDPASNGIVGIAISIDGLIVDQVQFPITVGLSGSVNNFTATISYLSEIPITDYIEIVIINTTGKDISSNAGFFKIKQISGLAL